MYEAVCNIERVFSRSGEHKYVAGRAYRNHIEKEGYQVGSRFTYHFQPGHDATQIWVKDVNGDVVYFPQGEAQCLKELT